MPLFDIVNYLTPYAVEYSRRFWRIWNMLSINTSNVQVSTFKTGNDGQRLCVPKYNTLWWGSPLCSVGLVAMATYPRGHHAHSNNHEGDHPKTTANATISASSYSNKTVTVVTAFQPAAKALKKIMF